MGRKEVEVFLTDLAVNRKVASSTQNQALSALLFLYEKVLNIKLEDLDAVRAKKPHHLPVVLTFEETLSVINSVSAILQLVVKLLYGCGMWGIECVRLRVQAIDFGMNQILVRDGKGHKDRVTMLPENVKSTLEEHLSTLKIFMSVTYHGDLALSTCPARLKENIRMPQ